MKKLFFILLALLTVPGASFAEGEKELIKTFIEEFKALTEEEQVEAIANKNFVDGYLELYPKVAAAFQKYPEQKDGLNTVANKLIPQMKEYCWKQLDSEVQKYLTDFQERSYQERNDTIFSFVHNKLEIYLAPKKDLEALKSLQDWQEEPLFVVATLLQAEGKPPQPSSPLMHKKESCSQRISRPPKTRSMPSLQKLFSLS